MDSQRNRTRPGVIAILVVCAAVWVFFHRDRLTAADRFADSAIAHRMPPQQVYARPEADRGPILTFFQMSDFVVDSMVVRDIDPYPAELRWAHANPTLKFLLSGHKGQTFVMDFNIADTTFKTTGPVTLTVTISDHMLASVTFDHPGSFHFEKAVPDAWLENADYVTVEAPVDKVWTSPTDGARFGYLLADEGFREGSAAHP